MNLKTSTFFVFGTSLSFQLSERGACMTHLAHAMSSGDGLKILMGVEVWIEYDNGVR